LVRFVRFVPLVLLPAAAVVLLAGGRAGAQNSENEACLACHTAPGMVLTLPSTENVSVTIDPQRFAASPHGKAVTCATCHPANVEIPHPALKVATLREFQRQAVGVCQACHTDRVEQVAQSVHGRAAQMGFDDVPVCTTCHNPHDAARVTSAAFRNNIPQLCGTCHADPRIIEKYGLRPVYESYSNEFHGVTTTLYKLTKPAGPAPAAVCTDCHGEHDIRAAADPASRVNPANLLKTCQQCHPTAGRFFATAWTEHKTPGPEAAPLVWYVQIFYSLLIPSVVAFLVVLTVLDLSRWATDQLRGARRR
jgi:predicted CXXCH cytochrome family protein